MLGPRSNNSWRNRYIALGVFGLLCWFLLGVRTPGTTPFRAWKATTALARYTKATGKTLQASRLGQHPFREPLEYFEKPLDFRIVGLVFYGRKEYVQILECYLQASLGAISSRTNLLTPFKRNLVRNGGMLDEVIFVVRTDDPGDLKYLDELLPTVPEYKKYRAKGRGGKYKDAWNVVQKGTMYIKIDDDVLFFEDHTIGALVKRRVEHPEYLLVSANVVNQPALAWVHFHLNTIHPYFPELEPPADFLPASHPQHQATWRASELPLWTGPTNYTIHPNFTQSENYKIKETFKAPFKGHRWLPLGPTADIDKTPAAVVKYSWHGAGYYSWVVGAQVHYSFLENLEKDELWRYKFDLWDYHHDRISINFICIWGDDIVANRPFTGDDDEKFLTVMLTQRLGRHAVLDGTGVAVHYGFHKQIAGKGPSKGSALLDTDLLERYKAYADENVCHI